MAIGQWLPSAPRTTTVIRAHNARQTLQKSAGSRTTARVRSAASGSSGFAPEEWSSGAFLRARRERAVQGALP